MPQDSGALLALMKLLGRPTPDVPEPARTDAEDAGGAYFERAQPFADYGDASPSRSPADLGFTRGDINLPRDPNPLDTNRLPPSTQSDADFESQVIAGSPPRQGPRTFPNPDLAVRGTGIDATPDASVPPPAASGRATLARMLGVPTPAGAGVQPPPDPAESAAVLSGGAMRANDPQALARNRYDEGQDLERRVQNESAALAMPPMEGFVPGEPGRRYLSRGMSPANLVADKLRLGQVRGEAAADPFTGDAETARIGGINKALDAATLTQRPEIGDAAKTVAERNAFAEYMKAKGLKTGELEAQGSPAGLAAAMTPIRAVGSGESQDILDAGARRTIAIERAKNASRGIKYSAAEQALLDAGNSVQELGPQLLSLLESEHPGIGTNPQKFGSWTDTLGAKIGGGIYRLGKSQTASSDRINQLTGYLEAAIPRMLATGRLNQQQYEDLKLHAPQVGFSDGANYERLQKILKDILPAVFAGVDAGHSETPTAIRPGGGVDPNTAGDFSPPTPEELRRAAPDDQAELLRRADALVRGGGR